MRAELIPFLGSWLLTYLLHSTLLLGGAYLVTRRLIQSAAVRELVWKAALLGGFVTATLQIGLGLVPLSGAVALELGGRARPEVTPFDGTPAVKADAWQGLLPAEEPPTASALEAAPPKSRFVPLAGPSGRRARGVARGRANLPASHRRARRVGHDRLGALWTVPRPAGPGDATNRAPSPGL